MDDVDPRRLQRALAALLPGVKEESLRRLGGGLNNVSYVAAAPGGPYVLRFLRSSPGVTLALAEELALLGPLSAAGITPAALGIDEATGALLTRFVADAVQWTPAAARVEANMARIAGLLRRMHSVPARTREFDPVGYAERYIAAAARRIGPRERRLAALFRREAAEYGTHHRSSAVCHNDLAAANVLDRGSELLLIDFEYAVSASPVVDLASLAVMNDYDRAQQRELLRAYFMTAAAPVTAEEFAKVVRLVRLLAYFWALAAECAHGEESPYSRLDPAEIE